MPSGTMANLAALTAHAPRGSRVLVGRDSDIHRVRGARRRRCAAASPSIRSPPTPTAGSIWRTWRGAARGLGRPAVLAAGRGVRGEHREPGAAGVPSAPRPTWREVAEFARRNGLAVHLDGARIFNAAVALGTPPRELAAAADSVQFCLSKGLSARRSARWWPARPSSSTGCAGYARCSAAGCARPA